MEAFLLYSPEMKEDIKSFTLIAGKGVYPLLLAESARQQGVSRIHIIAFRGETDKSIKRFANSMDWFYVGQLEKLLDSVKRSGCSVAIMAGQITPSNLFTVRLDSAMAALLKGLRLRNAETIFGAVAEEMRKIGVNLLPASAFMQPYMPKVGVLTARGPTHEEELDIAAGFKTAAAVSSLDIGQTVVMKQGTVIAVEAFEGTNKTLKRAGELAGAGTVVVKTAKQGHDMRFDIPVIGTHTIKVLRKARSTALALEAGRSIILEQPKVIADADKAGICIVAVAPQNG